MLLKKARTKANTKNGSQQMVKALMMIPKVVLALRSLANWNRSFFWWEFVLGLARGGISALSFWGCCLIAAGVILTVLLPSIGHCDSLLRLEVKHWPSVDLSRLYCNVKHQSEINTNKRSLNASLNYKPTSSQLPQTWPKYAGLIWFA